MAFNKKKITYKSINDLGIKALGTVLEKRVNFHVELFKNWPFIVGQATARACYPCKLTWPSKPKNSNFCEDYVPALLILHCDAAIVTEILHQKTEIIARVNSFFGYKLVEQLRLIQNSSLFCEYDKKKALASQTKPLPPQEKQLLNLMVQNIEDDRLKAVLLELGANIYKKKYLDTISSNAK